VKLRYISHLHKTKTADRLDKYVNSLSYSRSYYRLCNISPQITFWEIMAIFVCVQVWKREKNCCWSCVWKKTV